MLTKVVLRYAAIERIRRKIFAAFYETKILLRYKQVQETTLTADAAVAVGRLNICWRINLKLYTATVAATLVRGQTASFAQIAKWLFAGIVYRRKRRISLSIPKSSSRSMSRIPISVSRA